MAFICRSGLEPPRAICNRIWRALALSLWASTNRARSFSLGDWPPCRNFSSIGMARSGSLFMSPLRAISFKSSPGSAFGFTFSPEASRTSISRSLQELLKHRNGALRIVVHESVEGHQLQVFTRFGIRVHLLPGSLADPDLQRFGVILPAAVGVRLAQLGQGGEGFGAAGDFVQRVGLPVKRFVGMRAFFGSHRAESLYGFVPTAGVDGGFSLLEAVVIGLFVGGLLEEALALRRFQVLPERQPGGGQRDCPVNQDSHQETQFRHFVFSYTSV